MGNYSKLPVSFVRGEGASLWDANGNEYLDALGGIAVTFLGHCHPTVSQTISLQANTLIHTSNLFHISGQAKLAESFCRIAGMDKVFFGNSGAEANEAAIKLTRLYAKKIGVETPTVITFNDSFHGRTMATLSATGNAAIKEGFSPILADFAHVDYNNIEALKEQTKNPNVVAVMLEPIQGEGGIIVPDSGFLKEVRQLCDDNNWLMICDEIQTGMGRTGRWFAFQHEEIQPDIVTSAKALGNGIPIGACAAKGVAADLMGPGSHGSTFGGNPFCSQVALSVIDVIETEEYVSKAAKDGSILKKSLQQHLANSARVVDIRGKGLMIGIELDKAYPNLAQSFLDHRLIVNITGGGKVIRLLPPVICKEAQLKQIAETISLVVDQLN